jgi:hypothetical protein
MNNASALTVAAVMAALATPTLGQGALPDPTRTPGVINPVVTQETIGSTICVKGWTRTIRPPQQYTSALKRQQIRQFGYPDRRLSDYEEDHLIPLGLGGSPADPRNLWPEPRVSADGWNADLKDELEAVLVHMVCSGRVPLADAQRAIATDWIAALPAVRDGRTMIRNLARSVFGLDPPDEPLPPRRWRTSARSFGKGTRRYAHRPPDQLAKASTHAPEAFAGQSGAL